MGAAYGNVCSTRVDSWFLYGFLGRLPEPGSCGSALPVHYLTAKREFGTVPRETDCVTVSAGTKKTKEQQLHPERAVRPASP